MVLEKMVPQYGVPEEYYPKFHYGRYPSGGMKF